MRWSHRRRRLLLMTGGSGFLGQHLAIASEAEDWQLIAPPSTMIDIRNRERVLDEFCSWRPTAIAHLAYRKGDRQAIVEASRNVAEAATVCGARLVHISSDAIFPGRPEPYREHDTPFPITDYGVMKLEAERAVLAECPGAVIVRTSLLYGTRRPAEIQLDVDRAILGHRPMTFFTDEFRCPAHALDVARAVSWLASRPEFRGPLNVAGPEPVSRAQMAVNFAVWMGLDPNRLTTGSSALSGSIRPTNVVLDTTQAESHGLRCRTMAEALRRQPVGQL